MATQPSIAQETTVLGNRYEVESVIGEGAAAHVYRVRDRWTGAVRAAKVLKRSGVQDPQTLARFEDEYRILRTLHHPSLPEVHDYGWIGKRDGRFIIMDLVAGERLDHYFEKQPEDFWVLAYELCEVLVFIHSHNLLHQDIKPSNILVRRTRAYGDEMPMVTLLDFGLTYRRDKEQAVQMVGTAEYMAPEVIVGEAPLTRAVDYYSLGATLFELLTGAPPFTGGIEDILRGHLREDAVVEEERLDWAEVYPHVYALLSKDKKKRLEAYEAFRRAVMARLMGGIEALSKPYGLAYINSLGMIGKEKVWAELMEWLDDPEGCVARVESRHRSGKTFLLQQFVGECEIRGIRTLHPESDMSAYSKPAGEAYSNERLGRLLSSFEGDNQQTIVFFDADHEHVPSHVSTFFIQSAVLARTTGDPVVRMVATTRQSATGVISEAATQNFRISSDSDDIVALLGAPIDSKDDVVNLQKGLASCRWVGESIERVRAAITDGSVVYRDGTFRCPTQLREVPDPGESADLGVAMASHKDTLEIVACYGTAMPIALLAAAAGVARGDMAERVRLAAANTVFRVVTREGVERVIFANPSVGAKVLGGMNSSRRRTVREMLRQLLGRKPNVTREPTEELLAAIIQEWELGNQRDALARALRMVRSASLQGAGHNVEDLCLFGMELTVGPNAEPRIERARSTLVSRCVRNQAQRGDSLAVCRTVEEFGLDRRSFPAVVAFAVACNRRARWDESAAAIALLRANARQLRMDDVVVAGVEANLCVGKGKIFDGISCLERVRGIAEALPARQQAKYWLDCAIVYGYAGQREFEVEAVDRFLKLADPEKMREEWVSAKTLQAGDMISRNDTTGSLRALVAAMRVAHRNGLKMRIRELSLMASSLYYQEGKYDRALRYLQRAHALARRIGANDTIVTYLSRYALLYMNLGLPGNAMRYAFAAVDALEKTGVATHRVRALLIAYEICLEIDNPRRAEYANKLSHLLAKSSAMGNVAYYTWLQADECRISGNHAEATRLYRASRKACVKTGWFDEAVRVALREATMSLELDAKADFLSAKTFASQRARGMTNNEIVVRVALLRLREAYLGRSTIATAARKCEVLDTTRCPALLRLEHTGALIRAYMRTGNVRGVGELSQAYFDELRRVVANIDDPGLASRFMARNGIADLVSEFEIWNARQGHSTGSVDAP